MQQIKINGLRFKYDRDRDLFNALLKINGVSKKKFCEKFGLSYSYVNAWGSTTKEKNIKFPSWVLIYLKDVIYYKVEAIRIKMSLDRLYDELESKKPLVKKKVKKAPKMTKSGKKITTTKTLQKGKVDKAFNKLKSTGSMDSAVDYLLQKSN